MDQTTGAAKVIHAPGDASSMVKLSHAVLDDTLYNIVHDLLLKTHRDEKLARASSVAIRIEQAAGVKPESTDPPPTHLHDNELAVYDDGKVTLKENPLKGTPEILCPRCRKPRLLYPTDGKGSRKPDPTVVYCKKHPLIDKPGYDIYGQIWQAPGPGRGKKKKDMEKTKVADPASDSPGGANGAGNGNAVEGQRPPHVLSYPSATCSKCKRCILVTRLNNHMGSCIGNSGRNASRAAAQKISNGNGSQKDDNTPPPSSQKGTPAPGSASRASSPRKRDREMGDDPDGDDDSGPEKPKKKAKSSGGNTLTKVVLKQKGKAFENGKKEKGAKASATSGLGALVKVDDTEDRNSTVEVGAPVKRSGTPKTGAPVKKLKLGAKPPVLSSPAAKNGRDGDAESESSGTLSSPPGH